MKIFFVIIIFINCFVFNNISFVYGIDLEKGGYRVNIKCPMTLIENREGEDIKIAKYSLRDTLKLYDGIDEKLYESKVNRKKYVFRKDINDNQKPYIVYAKTDFKKGKLTSLKPAIEIFFLDTFFVMDIDYSNNNIIKLQNTKNNEIFTISCKDFNDAFIWYTDLIDSKRVYIPLLGFLSIPLEAKQFPVFYKGWDSNKEIFREELDCDFDFYKILDYRNGYYLLAEDVNEFKYTGKIKDYGIIGWVESKYIVLWRSRLYYHPLKNIDYYYQKKNDQQKHLSLNIIKKNDTPIIKKIDTSKSDYINLFYLTQNYPSRSDYENLLGEKTFYGLDIFYKNFGYPELYPAFTTVDTFTKVCILGSFHKRLTQQIVKSLKNKINAFFLLDSSLSMIDFKKYIKSFYNYMGSSGFEYNQAKIFAFNESILRSKKIFFKVFDSGIDDIEDSDIYGFDAWDSDKESNPKKYIRDTDFKEPLLTSFSKTLDHIENLIKNKTIYKGQIKVLFIITDAGANDKSTKLMNNIVEKLKKNNIITFFIIPDKSLIKDYSNENNSKKDTPQEAYDDLITIIDKFYSKDSRHFSNAYIFSATDSNNFDKSNKILVNHIKTRIEELKQVSPTYNNNKQHVVLKFIDDNLYKLIQNSSGDNININNHIVALVNIIDNPDNWEERIAVPAELVSLYCNTLPEDNVTFDDLKKLLIVNSLFSVNEFVKCMTIYDHIDKLLFKEYGDHLNLKFINALSGRSVKSKINWKNSLTRDQLREYLDTTGNQKRIFFLNSQKDSASRKYIYLKINELLK